MAMVKLSEQPVLYVGGLGAEVPAELADMPHLWTPFRLNEIEIHIRAIEDRLREIMPELA